MKKKRTLNVGWFEIPTLDMNRAIKFYESVFNLKLEPHIIGSTEMAWFPPGDSNKKIIGSLIKNEKSYKPGYDGILIYFSCIDVTAELDRVIPAGGKIILTKSQITPNIGFMGVFEDSEGNRIALHSEK